MIPAMQVKTTLNFLSSFFEDTPGLIEIRAISREKTRAKRIFLTKEGFSHCHHFLKAHSGWHLCFGVATRRGKRGNAVLMLPALFADIDDRRFSLNGMPAPTIIVDSGRGVHLYWMLERPLTVAFERQKEETEAILRGIAKRLNADMASTDVTRILRIPGTLNPKYNPPRRCKILVQSRTRYPLSLFEPLKVPRKTRRTWRAISLPAISDGIETVVEQCEFIRWCRDNQPDVPEPLWYAMISNLAVFEGGREVIHRFSHLHPNYSERETDYKIRHALKSTRPHTCAYIQAHGFNCAGCPWLGVVRSPAGIPYKIRSKKVI